MREAKRGKRRREGGETGDEGWNERTKGSEPKWRNVY